MKLTHKDYKVAWICALPLEMAAAKAMLDEVHDSLSQPATDYNAYTLGTIACLPAAATVLSHMLPTFPCLRFALMVGIGGGVPSKDADIRLGDVVVSLPSAMYPGVIQYDYGKTLHDRQFHQTGSLNKPPQFLLTAISQIRSNGMIRNMKLIDAISDILERHGDMQQNFSRPSDDWLFAPSYSHSTSNSDCLACDQSQLVERAPRPTEEPDIHYGLIASGNQVMKDAKTRDSIAQPFGILCFEMEAAGIMDQLPCLVIRGICDYCDSHKHKQWQGYAALVAAAYARTVLLQVPLHDRNTDEVRHSGHWMVPFDQNARFMGREDIIVRLDQWLTQRNRPSKLAIHGLGGVGKTQIALEVAYRMRDTYPNLSIFWIPCTSYESVEQAYMNVAQKFGMSGMKPEEVKEGIRNYLSQDSAGEWLLIFDNADDLDMWMNDSDTGPALKKFIPRSQQGHILFTTRNRALALKLASNLIPILEPDQDTSLSMLGSLIDSDLLVEKDAAIRLLEQLAYLPLAITQAASYIQENEISIPKYLQLLEGNESETIELLSEDFEDEGRYDTIQNPPVSENEGIKAIGLLKAYSFVSEQSEGVFLALHRLNNDMFRMQFSNVFPTDDHFNRTLWREYLPHVLALIDEDDFLEKQHEIGNCLFQDGRHKEAERLALQVLHINQWVLGPEHLETLRSGRLTEAEGLEVQSLKTRRGILGSKHPETLRSMDTLALIYCNQGRLRDAEELGVQVLEARGEILGFKHHETLRTMASLAVTYWNQGRLVEAEELGIQALEGCRDILGFKHPDTLFSMANLSVTYWNQGRLTEAEELGVQVLEARREILGSNHPETLRSMANLAVTYWDQGRLTEAEELRVQVLELRKQILGLYHPETLRTMANVAVLELRKRIIGPEHPETLASMNNLAIILHYLGKTSDALAMMEQCVHLRNKVLGHQHPHTIFSTQTLNDWIAASNALLNLPLSAADEE
ncbi:hypothetical protein BO94DRAFT_555415 [Aspergillus sclerotioniger CBS 115572]|uniref:AAA+ ATPase domain-containing protein n=1 Tax=Aspergillus sclerotioniger CBS 115572 TaxID=1450535 RepID=A0A317WYY5_9EURO|nr:hypothetical protein BO94DRAFT_555415 [Aspergillus sclerotioniger CBS 115572]PWY91604.1 hypothetical protein BO94DRAFT_555415 [Aspergillus sclerotioniger CBS 115572]